MKMKNYYYILGVHDTASIQEIKSAYRKLAIRLHPDKNAGDIFFEDRFRDLKEAYETLSDNLRKNNYDIKLGNIYRTFDNDALREFKELLMKRYKNELDETRKRYRTLEKELKEEAEKTRTREEACHKEEKYRLLKEIEVYKKLLEQKEQRLKAVRQRLSAAETEIIRAGKHAAPGISKSSKPGEGNADRKGHLSLQEHPEILRELEQIRKLIPRKDILLFLKMVLKYAETRYLPQKYGRDHPHLVKLILKNSIQMKPFKLFFAKHRNDPKMINNLKSLLMLYFNIFPI